LAGKCFDQPRASPQTTGLAGRGRSKAEFTAKLGIVIEEADETVLWLELLGESGIIKPSRLRDLLGEANQLLAIFAAAWRTLRG
jgi:four helix bundle protein